MSQREWTAVSKNKLCPACGKPDWCAWSREGWLKCERTVNPPERMRLIKEKDGGALFAPLDADAGPVIERPRKRTSSSSDGASSNAVRPDPGRVLIACTEAIDNSRRQQLAEALGLPISVLCDLALGWADEAVLKDMKASGAGWREEHPNGAWVFAERDGGGRVVGLALRAEDGRKGAPRGGKRGLVVPASLAQLPGPVLIVEGASDVLACSALGLASVGRPSNAAGAEELSTLLTGREILVVGENDAKDTGAWPGRDGAKKIAMRLARVWDQPVPWTLPPDGAKDIRSWYIERFPSPCEVEPEAMRIAGQELLEGLRGRYTEESAGRKSTADALVDLAMEIFELGQSDAGEPFAVRRSGPAIALAFKGNRDSLRVVLAREYRAREGRTPNSAALVDALTVMEGEASEARARRPLALRVSSLPVSDDRDDSDCAERDLYPGVVLDLGEESGRVVVIRPEGWELTDESPVLFRRSALTNALPEPDRGGELDGLRELLNVEAESWPMIVGWLVAALLPDIPHPILLLGGEQGTGKSTAARFIGSVVDPSPVPLRSPPRDPDNWAVAASGSWVVPIDNVSSISGWFSDTLCKVVTGDGIVRRALYTDSSISVLRFRRCVILTSIDAGSLRGDLGERLLMVDLRRIPDGQRRTEAELERKFSQLTPELLGALLDVLAAVLRELPRVHLDELPRMADFARVLAALDAARPDLTGGSALQTYLGQRGRIAEQVVESDCLAEAIRSCMESTIAFDGLAGELLKILTPEHPPRDWPKNGQALTGRLKRLQPALLEIGIEIDIPNQRTNRGRIITITRTDGCRSTSSHMSPLSPNTLPGPGNGGYA